MKARTKGWVLVIARVYGVSREPCLTAPASCLTLEAKQAQLRLNPDTVVVVREVWRAPPPLEAVGTAAALGHGMSATVQAGSIRRLIEVAAAAGASQAAMWQVSGITSDVEDRSRVAAGALFSVWSAAARQTPPDLPFEVTRRLEIEQLGVVGFALLTARDGAEAVETVARLFPIITDSGAWSMQQRKGTFVVNWHRAPSRCTGEHLSTEATLGHFVACTRQVFGPADAPRLKRVALAHSVHRSRIAALREYFDCSLELNAARDCLEWDADLSDAKPRFANRGMHEHFLSVAAPLLDAVRRPPPYAERVRAQLRKRLAEGEPAMADVARALGVATRSLRRRLADERTAYHHLLDEVRMQLAGELLGEAGASVTKVALELGFSDSTAFARAHKRWHGQAPTGMRRSPRRE